MSDRPINTTVLIHDVKTPLDAARPVRVEEEHRLFSKRHVLKERLNDGEELLFLRKDGRIRIIGNPGDIDLDDVDKEAGGRFVAVPKRDSQIMPQGENRLAAGELLFRLLPDGTFSRVDKGRLNELPADEELRLFAVQTDPFDLTLLVDLGKAKEGFHWSLRLGGTANARISRPEAFLARYYAKAKDAPFTVQAFIDALGTRPANLLLDEILLKSMEVLTLDDLSVDMAQWADQRNLTENAFTEALATKEGTPFFKDGDKGAEVAFVVDSVQFFSLDRDEAIANGKQRRQKLHDLEMAEIDSRIAALSGPRPEIMMKARVLLQGSRYDTRDLFPHTSAQYIAAKRLQPGSTNQRWQDEAAGRVTNRLAIGDFVTLELSANIDGWLHLYNYGTSGNVHRLVPGPYSGLPEGRILAGRTYVAEDGGNLIGVPLVENGPTTAEKGYLERFIAIITKYPVKISAESVKAMFDKRNPGSGFAVRGGFGAVEEVRHDEEPLEEAVASLVDLSPEDWVQGTLELEVV